MRILIFTIAAFLLASCTNLDSESRLESVLGSVDSTGKPLPQNGRNNSRTLFGNNTGQRGVEQITAEGSGQFVSSRAPAVLSETRSSGEQGFSLNLVDAPIAAAAKNVLGDTLGVNYTVDGAVRGNLTLQTSSPVSKEALIDIFEAALATNGATIVQSGQNFQIVPLGSALASTPAVSVPSVARNGPGVQVQVIELKFISAEEMKNILGPISREGSILKTDNARNYIMIAGTRANLRAMRDAISVFDVDWMRGMSVALHPLTTSQPTEVARELETIFGASEGPGANIIRFVPNDRLRSVLVITSRPAYLRRAAKWINKLDRLADSSEERLFVYNIQNRPAAELASVLQSVLGGESTGSESASVSPDLRAVEVSAEGSDPAEGAGAPTASVTTKDGIETSVVADEENNALLISTTAREYKRIEQILLQLDVLPTQVFLEAVIAEVSLNDELRFGVRWFFEQGNFNVTLSDLASGAVGASFPGLGLLFETNDIGITLNALSSVTDVNVISSPNLMALNNQEAILQIGDQVPIITQTSTATESGTAPVISNVELRDTGIILSMTPRVNASGRILLDIEQEVSDVVQTTTSGIDSPTIQQRKIQTRVIVNDGEALALGGLIQEQNTSRKGQVPILGEVPFLGNLFRDKTSKTEKTELIIFIRPRIIRDVQEARWATDEFRRKLDFRERSFPEKVNKEIRRLK